MLGVTGVVLLALFFLLCWRTLGFDPLVIGPGLRRADGGPPPGFERAILFLPVRPSRFLVVARRGRTARPTGIRQELSQLLEPSGISLFPRATRFFFLTCWGWSNARWRIDFALAFDPSRHGFPWRAKWLQFSFFGVFFFSGPEEWATPPCRDSVRSSPPHHYPASLHRTICSPLRQRPLVHTEETTLGFQNGPFSRPSSVVHI